MLVASFGRFVNPSGSFINSSFISSGRLGLHDVKNFTNPPGAAIGVAFVYTAIVVTIYKVFKRVMNDFMSDFLKQHEKINSIAPVVLFSAVQLACAASATLVGLSFTQAWLIAGSAGIALAVKDALKFLDNHPFELAMENTLNETTSSKQPLELPAQVALEVIFSKEEEASEMIVKEDKEDPSALFKIGDVDLEAIRKYAKRKPIGSDTPVIYGEYKVDAAFSQGKRKTMEDTHYSADISLEMGSMCPILTYVMGMEGFL